MYQLQAIVLVTNSCPGGNCLISLPVSMTEPVVLGKMLGLENSPLDKPSVDKDLRKVNSNYEDLSEKTRSYFNLDVWFKLATGCSEWFWEITSADYDLEMYINSKVPLEDNNFITKKSLKSLYDRNCTSLSHE